MTRPDPAGFSACRGVGCVVCSDDAVHRSGHPSMWRTFLTLPDSRQASGEVRMSADARAYVTRYSPYRGATYTVHQAIAEIVNDTKGWRFWMGRDRLAKRSRVTTRAVEQALASLESGGFLVRLRGGKGRPCEYRFVFVRGLTAVVDDHLFAVDNDPATSEPRSEHTERRSDTVEVEHEPRIGDQQLPVSRARAREEIINISRRFKGSA